MHYDLDLAIAYACALGLFCWLASWVVPLALRIVYGATAAWVGAHSRRGGGGAPPGALASHSAHADWWGPAQPQ